MAGPAGKQINHMFGTTSLHCMTRLLLCCKLQIWNRFGAAYTLGSSSYELHGVLVRVHSHARDAVKAPSILLVVGVGPDGSNLILRCSCHDDGLRLLEVLVALLEHLLNGGKPVHRQRRNTCTSQHARSPCGNALLWHRDEVSMWCPSQGCERNALILTLVTKAQSWYGLFQLQAMQPILLHKS